MVTKIFALLCLLLFISPISGEPSEMEADEPNHEEKHETNVDDGYKTYDGGLKIKINHKPEDCDYETRSGDTITWDYYGTLLDGTVFDKGEYSATLGAGHVIQGVDRAMLDMCMGEKRHMIIPSDLAYGDRGYPGAIPPKATIQFDVTLKNIRRGQEHNDL